MERNNSPLGREIKTIRKVDRDPKKIAIFALRLALSGSVLGGVVGSLLVADNLSSGTSREAAVTTSVVPPTKVAPILTQRDIDPTIARGSFGARGNAAGYDSTDERTYMNYLVESCKASPLAMLEDARPESFIDKVLSLFVKKAEAAPLEAAETPGEFLACIQDIEKQRPFLSNLEEKRPELGRQNIDVENWDTANILGLDSFVNWRARLQVEMEAQGFNISQEAVNSLVGSSVQITFRNKSTGQVELFTAQILDDKAEVDRRRGMNDRTVHWSGEQVWMAFDPETNQAVGTLQSCDNIFVPVPVVPIPETPTPTPTPTEIPIIPTSVPEQTPTVTTTPRRETPTPPPTQPPLPTATPRRETPTPVPTQPPLPTATVRVESSPTAAPTQPPLPTATPKQEIIPTAVPTQAPLPTATTRPEATPVPPAPTEVPPSPAPPKPAPTFAPTAVPLPTLGPRAIESSGNQRGYLDYVIDYFSSDDK